MQPTHRGDAADKINRIYMALILGHETLLSLVRICRERVVGLAIYTAYGSRWRGCWYVVVKRKC
jgi:hypothetical protein